MRLRRAAVESLSAVPLLAALALAAPQPPAEAQRFAEIDALVQRELERTGAPGAAVAIVQDGRIVLAKGYGLASLETRATVDAGTLFQIGSLTKAFTAAAVLTAALDGTLPLETPAGQAVSGIRPCLGKPTIGQLLSHTGGLIDEPDEFGPQGEEGLAAYPRTWTDGYCLLPPGRAFSYSNSGYALAGLALQERAARPFADVMKARVLEPLGMARTTFRPTEAMTWPLAVGHRRRDGVTTVVRPLPNDARLWPAGTLYSSAQEMARFAIALLDGGRLDDRQALPAQAVKAITTAQASIPALSRHYGYGWEIDRFRGHTRVSHGGSMTGYAGLMALLPDRRFGVVALSNGDSAFLSAAGERALELAAPEVGAPSPPAPGSRRAALLDNYTGTFANPRRFTVEVVLRGAGLVLRRFGRDFPMRSVDASVFLVDQPGGGDERIVFGLDAAGRAEYLQMNVWALARVGR